MSAEKITCLAIGDPHFQVNNVQDAEELIKKVNILVEEQQPTFVVILGDLLHTHEKIHTTPFNLATRFITSLARKVQVFLIIGNHDYCFGENVPILLRGGTTKLAKDIQIGDMLVGDDYTPRAVLSTTSGKKLLYTVESIDTSNLGNKPNSFQVTADHLLSLLYISETSLEYVDISAEEFYNLPEEEQNKYRLYKSIQVRKSFASYSYGLKVTPGEMEQYYGWSVDGNQRFLLADNTVVHNCNNQQFLTNKHPFNAFKKIDNVTVCDRVITRTIDGLKFVFCPYVPPERFEEALNTIKVKGKEWKDAECIFAHQEFYGCSFNPVATSTDGDIWPETYPLVVSGHIHNEQRLQNNIYYTGSSMQHAFGETANKTIAMLTFHGGQAFQLQKIDLEMRKKKIIYMNVEDADTFKPEKNTLIKLVLKGKSEQFKVFRRGQTFKDLQKMNVAISFSAIQNDDTIPIKNPEKKNILDILRDLVKDENQYVQEAFRSII